MHGCTRCHLHPSQPLHPGGTLSNALTGGGGGSNNPLSQTLPRQSVWGHATVPATSWLRGRTQIAAAPPDSLRVWRFPPPHLYPEFPAFEPASPQKHHLINNPTGVLLCTVPCPVPATFPASLCPCHGRGWVLGWHRRQDKVCPLLGLLQPSCTCARRGWGQAGAPGGQSGPSCFLSTESVAPVSQVQFITSLFINGSFPIPSLRDNCGGPWHCAMSSFQLHSEFIKGPRRHFPKQ